MQPLPWPCRGAQGHMGLPLMQQDPMGLLGGLEMPLGGPLGMGPLPDGPLVGSPMGGPGRGFLPQRGRGGRAGMQGRGGPGRIPGHQPLQVSSWSPDLYWMHCEAALPARGPAS